MSEVVGTATNGAAMAGMAAAGPIGWAGLAASFLTQSGVLQAPPMTPDNTYSGQVAFDFQKAFSPIYNKPLIDLENPVHIGVLVGLGLGAIVLWKKYSRK